MILAIETSCDETSASVVHDGQVLSLVTYSQIERHQPYGGVYPELASRLHLEAIIVVIDQALQQAGVDLADLQAVAVTRGPGLVGALHIGLQAAKTLAMVQKIPLIGVNHIHGHIAAAAIEHQLPKRFVALVVSGGHTEFFLVDDYQFQPLGGTIDDAAGEAGDKVARLLGLPYPGGLHLDRLAQTGEPSYPLPFPKNDQSYDFSFSGLKTAVLNLVSKLAADGEIKKADVACSFNQQLVHVLLTKTQQVLADTGIADLVVCGGVAANSFLRQALVRLNCRLYLPSLQYCGDNAAMIGILGEIKWLRGQCDPLTITPLPQGLV